MLTMISPSLVMCHHTESELSFHIKRKMGLSNPLRLHPDHFHPLKKNYYQLDKEALALIFGVKKFCKYLYGRSFTLFTDHEPLMHLLSESKAIPPMASARIQRWALALSCYQYTVKYRIAKEQIHAVDELHDIHLGISRMKRQAHCYLWWPKMDSDLDLLMPHFILGNGLTNHGLRSTWT